MINYWIILGALVLIGLYLIGSRHFSRKIKIIVVLVLIGLVYFLMMSISQSQPVDLTSPKGVVNSVVLYFTWIGQTTGDLWDIGVDTTHLVGNAIKVDRDDIVKEKENKK